MLQLGRQTFLTEKSDLRKLFAPYGIGPKTHPEIAPNDTSVFSALGFQDIYSCDLTDRENATYVANLNYPVTFQDSNQFDCILDGGTLEHIFNLPQALDSMFHLLKPEGRIIHFAVSSNFIDHGLYMFSPAFFHEFYSQNSYEILDFFVCEFLLGPNFEFLDTWKVYDYHPGIFDKLAFTGTGSKTLAIFCVVKKTIHTKNNKDIIQNYYRPDQPHSSPQVFIPKRVTVFRRMLYRLKEFPITWIRRWRGKPAVAFKIGATGQRYT